jgi:hypothetical protein
MSETSTTKYFKTIVRFEVISEDEPFSGSLSDLDYQTQEGGMSGRFLESEITELTPEQTRAALEEQGSDQTFFTGLDCDPTLDEIHTDPRFSLLEGFGFEISPDESTPGKWNWHAPTEDSQISFGTPKLALDAAWTDVCDDAKGIRGISNERWDLLTFEQKSEIVSELFADLG